VKPNSSKQEMKGIGDLIIDSPQLFGNLIFLCAYEACQVGLSESEMVSRVAFKMAPGFLFRLQTTREVMAA
jgi:hypothetical protein